MSKSGTILVVEDDPGVASLERRKLERAGYAVVNAPSHAEAMQKLRDGGVDLMLLDYRMPGEVDGLDFYAQVRSAGHEVPVILVTGFSSEAIVIKAIRAGVRDFVTKSVEYLDYLPEAVERVLLQVRTEQRLAESEARLAAIIGSAKDAILIADRDQRITLFNAAAEEIFRCPASQAVGQPLSRFIPKEYVADAPRRGGDAGQAPESLTHQVRMGTRGVRPNGDEFPLEASVARVEVGGRKFHTIMVRDVTERKRAEEALRLRDRALESFAQGVVITDASSPDRPIIYANPGFLRLTGYSPDEVLRRNCRFLQGPDTDPAAVEEIRAALREERACLVEVLNYRKDGQPFWNALSIAPVRDAAGKVTHFAAVQTDVSEFKRLEGQYLQSQKMEAFGKLAGGVAHDFNNLLTIILSYGELLLPEMPDGHPSHEFLQEIIDAGERASALTRQLLAFSRKQILAPVVLDLNALLTEMDKMLARLIGADIDMACSHDPALRRVKADPGQVEQVLMNLVVNARDAMPTGGHLTIETRNVDLDEAYVRQHPYARPGPHVRLAVTDTGCGMAEATRARIFEPFFTTKEVGKGTGLGLATVFGIVKQSGGHVEVYSEVGHGTTFKVYLPSVQEAIHSGTAPAASPAAPRGGETILLAEDEEALRRLSRIALESSGYTVIEARDGEEALRIFREHPAPIHLLMTDVVMPKMSGRQLADRARALRPGLKVLCVSGYTDDAVIRHGVLDSGMPFLQKPFTPSILARKVREVLDE